jgi:hypothetical protein
MTTWASEKEVEKPKELWEGRHPVDEAGFFSKVFYYWTNELLTFSKNKKLNPSNIGKL